MRKLTIVLAESALELVPREIWDSPAVKKYAERRGREPGQILLDRSYHHFAMLKLKNASKRGRPDIIHTSLLYALGSPLWRERLLDVYVHTIGDYVITIDPTVRLPRNYERFVGLIEQLFEVGKVPPRGKVLLTLKKESLSSLIDELKPTSVVAFVPTGKPALLSELMNELSKEERPVVIIGGFARGEFSDEALRLAKRHVCIDPEELDAWVVVSKVVHEYERAIDLPEKRLGKLRVAKKQGAAGGI